MATSASFSSAPGLLTAIGDAAGNTIVASRGAAGKILLNNGITPIAGGTPTVANTSLIQAFGLGGDDTISLDESNGALPAADLFGGAGDDTLTGGSGNDLLFGQDGDDMLFGKGGNDLLFGGDGDDALTGGTGSDQVFGEAGDDRMIWNPGDGSDLFEGGDGIDTAEVNGGNGAETFTIAANGARVRFDRVSPAPFSLDIGTTENLVLHAGGGDDVITAGNGLATLISLTLDGGDGADAITGGDGADTLIGGAGNDLVTGGRGNDTASLGDGADTFVWNPGDGSDTVEGGAGFDTLQFNGANVSEKIDISANGGRVRFFRDVGNVTMDLNGIERINFSALGGADNIVVHDLGGTGVNQVAVDLASPPGSGAGDGQADTVTVEGTGGADHIAIAGSGASIAVSGLPAQVTIDGAEGANDSLVVDALGGADTIDASAIAAGEIRLTIDGGDGDDAIAGSQGGDTLIGGDGNDAVIGGRGDDVALLGSGDDTFTWNPGDGSDIVEGQAGTDTLLFNGSNASERIDISANGARVRFTRDVASVAMDLNGVEHIRFTALGGADTITVNDLAGTDVNQVAVDLARVAGSVQGDAQPDSVIVNGTNASDAIRVASSGASVVVSGLAATTTLTGLDAGLDTLTVNGLGGDDVIDASSLRAGQVNLTINGGDGNDLIVGSARGDLVLAGRGSDTALLGAGNDTFTWNPGDGSDIVEGQAGTDTLLFNGANVSEKIDISANGARVRFTRDVGSITMDLNGVEHIHFNALGGADTITVNDLTGTSIKNVDLDLSSPPGSGAGDGQADTIIINATSGADVISVTSSGGVITVSGLAATVTIAGAELANDQLIINGLGGDDVITASGLTGGIRLTANGGDGDDVIIGSINAATLTGGAGDDVLIGGPGLDVLDGGPGDNILIQDGVSASLAFGALSPSAGTSFAAASSSSLFALAPAALTAHPHA